MDYIRYDKIGKENIMYTTYKNNYCKNNGELKEEYLKLKEIICENSSIKRDNINMYKLALKHSDNIIDIDKLSIEDYHVIQIDDSTTLYEAKEDADSIITRNSDNILVMPVADCMCIYLVDEKSGVYSLVHSGWRGTILNILPKTIEKLHNDYGSCYSDMKIIISPHILKDSFEIQEDAIGMFEEYIEKEKIDKNLAIEEKEEGKYYIDLDMLLLNSIKKYNIPEKNIFVSNEDTLSSKDEEGNYKYHSFRRDKMKSGRNTGVLFI